MRNKFRISDFGFRIGRRGGRLACSALRTPHSALRNFTAFSLIELMVVMALLSLIVLALMEVFTSTQRAFRASVTQTDILEGSRAALDLITTDLRAMTPSDGANDVNFFELDNGYVYIPSVAYWPLRQSLPGSGAQRVNVLNYFFVLGRNNINGRDSWTGTGYVVNATNASPLYPLYRFYAETNIAVPPYTLFTAFTNAVYYSQWTNLSHVLDGVVHLTVRTYDNKGIWLTNGYSSLQTNRPKNVWFAYPYLGEVGSYFYSNAVPAAVEIQLGVLEDRALQRAESLPAGSVAQSNYLAGQSGSVHLFRQRVTIPNVDPSAYQP